MSPSFTNVVAHIPIYCHQGKPTGNETKKCPSSSARRFAEEPRVRLCFDERASIKGKIK